VGLAHEPLHEFAVRKLTGRNKGVACGTVDGTGQINPPARQSTNAQADKAALRLAGPRKTYFFLGATTRLIPTFAWFASLEPARGEVEPTTTFGALCPAGTFGALTLPTEQ
jgi:hypothetical protein